MVHGKTSCNAIKVSKKTAISARSVAMSHANMQKDMQSNSAPAGVPRQW